jgi:hypothetical protein
MVDLGKLGIPQATTVADPAVISILFHKSK